MGNTAELLLLFSMFGMVTLLWYQIFQITTEESIVITALFIMLGIFVCGLVQNVNLFYVVMTVLSVLSIITFIFNISIIKSENDGIRYRLIKFVSPSMVIIAVVFCYGAIAFRRALYTYPDEYFQWGAAIKYMYSTHKLPYGDGFTGENVTLSMATMFQYFWTGRNLYVESNTFLGNFLLAFIPALLPFSGCTWKKWKEVFLYSAIIFLSFNIFTYVKYYNLLQDLVLPLWAGGIIAWLIWKEDKEINWVLVGGSLCVIGAMKSLVGPLFAMMVCFVLVIRQWIYYEMNFRKWKRFLNIKVLGIGSTLLGCMFSISFIWSKLVNQNVLNRTSSAITNEAKDFVVIIKGMINRAFQVTGDGGTAIPYVSYAGFFVICLFILTAYWKIIEDKKQRLLFRIVMSLYIVGFVGYFSIMLYAYLYIFGYSDSMIVAGLERYFAYYMLLGVGPLVIPMFSCKYKKYCQRLQVASICIFVLFVSTTNNNFVSKASALNREINSDYQKRVQYEEYREKINALTGGQGKILLFGEISASEGKMLTYEFGNRLVWNQDCYKMYLRQKNESRVYVDLVTYPELIWKMGYEYVWAFNMDFNQEAYNRIELYYQIGDMKEGELYRVAEKEEGYCLEYVDNLLEME